MNNNENMLSMFPRKLRKYWLVWWTSAKLSLSSNMATRGASGLFILGKLFRFGAFVYFLFVLGGGVNEVSGYNLSALIIFFLVFNLFDLFGQLFFRGIYRFRQQVVSGEFDFRLVKPISPLFQALTRHTDFLDIPLLLMVIVALVGNIDLVPAGSWWIFGLVSLAGFILITAIHVVVASLGVITTEVDHSIMIYRDLAMMARFPVDIYTDAIRGLLTFVIPIAIIFTYPAKAFLGLLTWENGLVAFGVSLLFLYISLKLWRYALTQYSSASS